MKLIENLHNRAEEVTGTVFGSVAGYVAHKTFQDILITLSLALLTGFLGGAGASLWKWASKKFTWPFSRKRRR